MDWRSILTVPAGKRSKWLVLLLWLVVAGIGGGLDIKVTGPAGFSADAVDVFTNIDTKLLLATTTLVVVLLLLIYRSPILWIVPLIALGFAEISAQAVAYGMASAGLTVSGQTGGLLTVLVFGAGTDYALLLIARYREELRRHADKHDSMRSALRQTGPAILASGGTVTIALLCLLIAELNSTRGLGPIGAIGIVMAVISMLTALPALLLVFGRRIFWPAIPHVGDRHETESGLFGRLARWIEFRPRSIATVVLAIMALGLLKTNTGLNSLNGFRSTPDSVLGQRLLAQSFPAGASASTYIFVRPAGDAAAARAAALRTPGIASVSPVRVDAAVARLDVTLASPPYGNAAFDTISRLRDNLRSAVNSAALTGGPSAQELDTRLASVHDAKVIVPLVLLTVLIILAVLLRAIAAPLVLVATVILSCAAALGVSVVVFDRLFGFAGIDPSLPLLAFVFLVALGIDYNIFLMARVREESERIGTHRGMLTGLTVTGGVITSAGIVLAGTFSILGILPLVALTEIGFIVAFGVLLDTFVVRSILVPALALSIGPRIWWPSALSRENTPKPTPFGQDSTKGREALRQHHSAEPNQESIWDYPRPPRLEATPKHIQVIFNGIVIADSMRTKRILETSHPPVYYIPPEDVRMEYLEPSSHSSFCEWKGTASYYDVLVDGKRATNAAWYYHQPTPAYIELRDCIAFYPAAMDICLVDGERAQPEAGRFYGGWVTRDILLR